ncbi:hypothetical protein N9Y89_00825 [bacterium]|nr:hypothetical protein [bacterium]
MTKQVLKKLLKKDLKIREILAHHAILQFLDGEWILHTIDIPGIAFLLSPNPRFMGAKYKGNDERRIQFYVNCLLLPPKRKCI